MNKEQPKRPKVYEVVVKNMKPLKGGGWKTTYEHVIKFPGWEEFFEESGF